MQGVDGELGRRRRGERPDVRRAVVALTSRTTDSRGYGSEVSRTHGMRSGKRDRRLYRGEWAAMSRSSRTRASSGVAHGIGSTRCATRTISIMRPRFSADVK